MEIDVLNLPKIDWMPSRIPVLDALVAVFPAHEKIDETNLPPSPEQRWHPLDDGGLRLLVPYTGGPFNAGLFHIEPKAWDHSTCDVCNARIPAMTLSYVTKSDPYIQLCINCYASKVASKLSCIRNLLWHIRQYLDEAAA